MLAAYWAELSRIGLRDFTCLRQSIGVHVTSTAAIHIHVALAGHVSDFTPLRGQALAHSELVLRVLLKHMILLGHDALDLLEKTLFLFLQQFFFLRPLINDWSEGSLAELLFDFIIALLLLESFLLLVAIRINRLQLILYFLQSVTHLLDLIDLSNVFFAN